MQPLCFLPEGRVLETTRSYASVVYGKEWHRLRERCPSRLGDLEVGSESWKLRCLIPSLAVTMSGASAQASSTNGPGAPGNAVVGKADQYVPVFDNVQRNYKEFRKRCELYKTKMALTGRSKETVFNIVTLLTGKAWDAVDDLDIETLQSETGYSAVFDRLDKAFKYDSMTELPEDFELFFVKLQRREKQTLQEYTAEFARAERQLTTTHGVKLPEKVRAWWFLRRSGVSKEQRQLILTNVGAEHLDVESIQKAMNFILGQDSKMEMKSRNKMDMYYANDDGSYDIEEDAWSMDWEPAYWQGDEDECGSPWPDQDEDYYETGPDEDAVFDVEEYDSVYASFAEARGKLNALRTSRGFYPVVALVDKPFASSSSSTRTKGKKGKSKTKKGKSHFGKGDSGKQGPLNPKGAARRGQAIVGRQLCLRCGQSGHWARNCPSGAEKKRKIEGEDSVMMVTEVFAMDQTDGEEDESSHHAVQDGGAASVLGSRHSIQQYLRYMMEIGMDVSTIEVFKCMKGFRYGNSATESTNLCLLLPIAVGGRRLRVLTYVIQGTAPLLFGRPILEQLGLTVDYGSQKMRWPDKEWMPIPRGAKGEHLLDLAEDKNLLLNPTDTDDVLMPDDFENHVDVTIEMGIQAILGDMEPVMTAESDISEQVTVTSARRCVDRRDNGLAHGEATAVGHRTLAKKVTIEESNSRFFPGVERPPGVLNNQIHHNDTDNQIHRNDTANQIHHNDTGNQIHNSDNADQIHDNESGDQIHLSGVHAFENDLAYHVETQKVKPLTKAKMHYLTHQATVATKNQKAQLAMASRVGSESTKLVWEVFSGKGRTSTCARELGAKTETFSGKTGWNFNSPKDRRKFLRRLRQEQPDEVLLSPPCRLWSSLEELSLANRPEQEQSLRESRQRDHRDILQFVAVIYEEQRRHGRHAHVEHPWYSRAWLTKAFSSLKGLAAYVDQCAYGLRLPGENGMLRPVRKATCFMTTKKKMYRDLSRECAGGHEHVSLEGHIGSTIRSSFAENCPIGLAKQLAKLMLESETEDENGDDDVYAEEDARTEPGQSKKDDGQKDEETEVIEANRRLRREVGGQAFSYIARLHKSLGHPGTETLLRMLEEVQATENVMKAAKGYKCSSCYHRQPPAGVPPAAGLTARNFNDRVVADSAWINTNDGRKCVLTLMCQATRYVAIRILPHERAADFIKGVERAWIKQFGVPKYLRVDEAKGWASQALRDWTSANGITLEVAPAECHNWLGSVERKHQVVRRALELFMDDSGERTLSSLKHAAVYVPGQINNMSFVRGFTPNQWVMGRSPLSTTSLSGDFFNPGVDALDEPSTFADVLQKRQAAQRAFIKADSDAKLRRSMNKNFRENYDVIPAVGQRCWYWRVQGTTTLQKSKWRGPARVVAHETNEEAKVTVIWLAHGTNLLRCGPHQVRPLVEHTGSPQPADPAAAMEALRDIRARSTTQFRDVMEADPHLDDLLGPDAPDLDDMDYEPSLPGDEALLRHASDADSEHEPVPVPGAVLLYQQSQEQTRRRRRISTATVGEPDPDPDAEVAPARPPEKRARAHVPRAASSSSLPVSGDAIPVVPSEIPVPEDMDEDLYTDVYVVDGVNTDLPEGWVTMDGELVIDEVWLARTEAREKDMSPDQRAQMMEAKRKELTSYFQNRVWEFANPDPSEQSRVITARWVLTWKEGEPAELPRAKARLVLRGFQDPDVLSLETASPTATRQSKLIIMALVPVLGWTLWCGDVRTAFLSGANFDRHILVRLPKDCGPLLGCHGEQATFILKSAYGLADAPLLWWKEADRRLREAKWIRHPLDRCLYLKYAMDFTLILALLLHVDDVLVGGDENHVEARAALKELRSLFDFGKWKSLDVENYLVYCGGRIEKIETGIALSYADYIKKVLPITVARGHDPNRALDGKGISKVRGLLGALQWPAVQGMPPLAATVSILAALVTGADGHLVSELNKALRFAKTLATQPLRMTRVANTLEDVAYVCFSDAAFGVRKDNASQGGYIIVAAPVSVLEGAAVPYNVISWRSFKLQRVCRSSLAAEAQACATALDELMMLKTIISMMIDPSRDPRSPATARMHGRSALVIDAKALYDAIKKPGFSSQQDKRAAIEILCIQQEIEALNCELRWVSSERMLGDGATKISARQAMADQMKTGIIKLTFDENFVAAKKKTVQQREQSAQATFGGAPRGSRIARHISNVLAATLVGEATGKKLESVTAEAGFHWTFVLNYEFLVAFGIVVVTSLMVAYVRTKHASTSSTSFSSSTATTQTVATQTSMDCRTLVEIEVESHRLRYQNAENEDRIHEFVVQHDAFERELLQTREAMRRMQAQQPLHVEEVYVTARGRVAHVSEHCGHIRGHGPRRFPVCRDCHHLQG